MMPPIPPRLSSLHASLKAVGVALNAAAACQKEGRRGALGGLVLPWGSEQQDSREMPSSLPHPPAGQLQCDLGP